MNRPNRIANILSGLKRLTSGRWIILLPAALLLSSCAKDPVIDASECTNALTSEESETGWRLLFDGTSTDLWKSYQEDTVNTGWGIENGCLTRLAAGGDLISRAQFANFELKLDWRISDSGNSGIFIRGDELGKSIHHSGFEMQILDNVGHWDARNPTHRAGAYYDMIAPARDSSKSAESWNTVHIIARGPQIEFRLNGETTAQFELGSRHWKDLYASSKFTDRPRYGSLMQGHIGFQDHSDKVWLRNIRILELQP